MNYWSFAHSDVIYRSTSGKETHPYLHKYYVYVVHYFFSCYITMIGGAEQVRLP